MEKRPYVSPEFCFQELCLFEGVADRCWAEKHCSITIFRDPNGNGTPDEGEQIIWSHYFSPDEGGSGNGCSNVDNAIEGTLAEIQQTLEDNGLLQYWTDNLQNTIMQHPNAGSSQTLLIPISG